MKLILKDKRFAIKSAVLSATIPDPYWLRKYDPGGDPRLFWCLNVTAEQEADVAAEQETDDLMWEAHLYHQDLYFPIRRWMDVAGQSAGSSEPYDESAGKSNGCIYIFEHEVISRGRLSFPERRGVTFRFEWEGVCDVHWNEEYGRDVPFSASGWAEFTGAGVLGSESDTDETLRGRLAQYLDPRDFVQGPLVSDGRRYDSRVKLAHAVFSLPW